MTELFTVRTPPDAWRLFVEHFHPLVKTERIRTEHALDRVLAEQLISPQDLPNFRRSTVDGYAVNAADTYGATPGLPAFLDHGRRSAHGSGQQRRSWASARPRWSTPAA